MAKTLCYCCTILSSHNCSQPWAYNLPFLENSLQTIIFPLWIKFIFPTFAKNERKTERKKFSNKKLQLKDKIILTHVTMHEEKMIVLIFKNFRISTKNSCWNKKKNERLDERKFFYFPFFSIIPAKDAEPSCVNK